MTLCPWSSCLRVASAALHPPARPPPTHPPDDPTNIELARGAGFSRAVQCPAGFDWRSWSDATQDITGVAVKAAEVAAGAAVPAPSSASSTRPDAAAGRGEGGATPSHGVLTTLAAVSLNADASAPPNTSTAASSLRHRRLMSAAMADAGGQRPPPAGTAAAAAAAAAGASTDGAVKR